MKKNIFYTLLVLLTLFAIQKISALPINIYIDSLSPKQNAVNVSRASNIIVYFTQTMNSATINSNTIKVYSSLTGFKTCNITYNAVTKSAILDPTIDFKYGDQVNVSLTSGIQTSGGIYITPFSYNFLVLTASAPAVFTQYSTTGTGTNPENIAEGDFNNDGYLDMAVSNRLSNNVSILMNNGNGNFTNTATLTTGTEPRYIITADFDKDSYLDLAVANFRSRTVIIFKNNGSGGFSQIASIVGDTGPYCIAAADFFNDGNIHLAVVNYTVSNVSIFKNNGNGSFSLVVNYYVPLGPVNLMPGDFNNDGNIDLAVASWNANTLSILLNAGNGGFSLTSSYPTGTYPHSIAVGDFNNDKNLDLAVANSNSNNINIFNNNGNGTFALNTTLNVGTEVISVATSDLNGDGFIDLAATSTTTGLSVYINNGTGTLSLSNTYPIANLPRRLAIGDYDSDGKIDIAIPASNPNNIIFLRNGYGPPAVPVLVYPPNGATGIILNPTFIWYSVNNATGYRIQVSASSSFSNILDSATVTTNQYSIPAGKLSGLITYYWRVCAFNTYGTSNWSIVWSFTTMMSVPPAPVLISPANNSTWVALTPTLYWEAITGVTNYKVQVSQNQNFTTLTDSAIVNNNQYQIPYGKLINNVKYYWRVNATNSYGTGPWSEVWNFTTRPTGINNISADIPKEFNLYNNYPNPFNPETIIEFDIPTSTIVTIIIYDALGREVKTLVNQVLSPGKYEINWNASGYSSGIYFYRIITEKYSATKKMLLIR
jgi:hypothetical protein